MGKRKNEEPDPRQPAQQAPGTLSKPAIPFIGKFLKGRGELRIVQYSVPARFSGRFPPDLSPLLGLGFGQVSSSGRMALVRKVESADFSGKPCLFTEIEIGRKSVDLRYSLPQGHSPEARHLQACLLLLRVLSLLPGLELGAAGTGSLLLPALEFSSFAAGNEYSLLHGKFSFLRQEAEELRQRSRKLQHSSEEEAAISVERERRISALSGRVSRLESVSDQALSELILEWISSHHGSFSPARFSQQNRVPPSRAEEGLESLLKSGAIRMSGGALHAQRQEEGPRFDISINGLSGRLRKAVCGLLGSHKSREE